MYLGSKDNRCLHCNQIIEQETNVLMKVKKNFEKNHNQFHVVHTEKCLMAWQSLLELGMFLHFFHTGKNSNAKRPYIVQYVSEI